MLETRPFLGEIYLHWCPARGKGYVGQTTQGCEKRWMDHVRHSRSPKARTTNTPFSRALRKYDLNCFSHQILAEAQSQDELDGLERLWIWALQTRNPLGYNLSVGGDGHTGVTHTVAAKQKMAAAKIGNTFCIGRKVSAETRIRLGNGNRGRKLSADWKNRIAAANVGRQHTIETKNKIANANCGRVFTPQHRLNLSIARRARVSSHDPGEI